MGKKPTLVYIHGATATSVSFSYIRNHFFQTEVLLNYDCSRGFYRNLAEMRQQLAGKDNLFFIAHSLGGIYALHLANEFKDQTVGGVTLSTPYGGSNEAAYLKILFPFSRLLKEVTPCAGPITDLKSMEVPELWANVVTDKSNGLWRTEPNDGVVTQASMRHRTDMELIDLNVNHYEVVNSPNTIDIIAERIKKAPATK
jgi:pimeloyl-ACP methyl ester carboxylesterase